MPKKKVTKKSAKAKVKSKEIVKKTVGRPLKYNKAIAERICLLISESNRGLHHICKQYSDLPGFSTIMKWLGDEDKKDFRDSYARAREAQAELLADEIIAIADDGSKDTEIRYNAIGEPYDAEDKEWTSRSKLRVEARKWKAAHLAPKKYGDKIDLTSGNKPLPQGSTVIQVEIVKPEE